MAEKGLTSYLSITSDGPSPLSKVHGTIFH